MRTLLLFSYQQISNAESGVVHGLQFDNLHNHFSLKASLRLPGPFFLCLMLPRLSPWRLQLNPIERDLSPSHFWPSPQSPRLPKAAMPLQTYQESLDYLKATEEEERLVLEAVEPAERVKADSEIVMVDWFYG